MGAGVIFLSSRLVMKSTIVLIDDGDVVGDGVGASSTANNC